MALPRPSPSISPAENYARFDIAFGHIDYIFQLLGKLASDDDIAAVSTNLNNLAATVAGLTLSKADIALVDAVQNNVTGAYLTAVGKIVEEANTRYSEDVLTRSQVSSLVDAVQNNLNNLASTVSGLSLSKADIALVDAVQTNLNNLADLVEEIGSKYADQALAQALQNNITGAYLTAVGKIVEEANTRYSEDVLTRSQVSSLAADTTERVDAARDLALQASVIGAAVRPGEGPAAFTFGSLSGAPGALAPLPASALAESDTGTVARVVGASRVTTRAAQALEVGRIYRARAVVRRRADTSDPSGDTVRVGIAWLDQAKNQLPGASGFTIAGDFDDLRVTNGRQEVAITTSRSPGDPPLIQAPALARFVRVYVQTYGLDGVTDVEVIDVTDLSASRLSDPVSVDTTARVGALEEEDLPARVAALETGAGTPLALTYSTRSDAAAATISASITVLRTLGRATRGDGGARDYRRVTSIATGADGFTSADGAKWQAVDLLPAMRGLMLNITRADIASQYTLAMRFRTIDGAPWKLGTSAGPYAIQNASGDWFEIDVSGGVIELEWFGAVGDFDLATGTGTDNKDAIARAFAAVPNRGTIALRSRYYGASLFPITFNKGYAIRGPGRHVSGLVSIGGASGPNIQLARDYLAILDGWTMLTTGVDVGTSITVAFNADPANPFADRLERRLGLNDFATRGVNPKTQGWNTHGHLTNIQGSDYSQWWMTGRALGGSEDDSQASNTLTPFGLILDGTVYPTDHHVIGLRAFAIDKPLVIKGACEGVLIERPIIVNCGWLLDAAPDNLFGGRPQLIVRSAHGNTYKGGIKVTAFQNVTFDDALIYRAPGSTSAWVGVDATDLVDADVTGLHIINKRVVSGAAETSTIGLQLSGTSTSNVRVAGNHLGGTYAVDKLGVGIKIVAGTPGVTIATDNSYNCVTPIEDHNPETTIVTIYGTRAATLFATFGGSIPNNVVEQVLFDTRGEDSIGVGAVGSYYRGVKIPAGSPPVFVNVSAQIYWDNGTGARVLELRKNGAVLPRQAIVSASAPAGLGFPQQVTARRVLLQPGDEIQLWAAHNHSGALTYQGAGLAWLCVEVVG